MESALSNLDNVDTVRFGAGITAADISITRHDYDIVLSINGTTDQLTLQNWGGGDAYRIERFEFADGNSWDTAQVNALLVHAPAVGAAGDDVLVAWAGINTLLQGMGGNDTLFGFSGDDTLDGGVGDDQLVGAGGADILLGGDGNDKLFGDSEQTLAIDHGNDYMDGGAGDDYLRGYFGDDVLLGGDGNDMMQGEEGNDSLDGGAGVDVMDGGAGNDILLGGAGDDDLIGGEGVDTLIGGTGNDVYSVDNAADSISEAADEGDDAVVSTISYTLGDSLERLQLGGSENVDASGNARDNGLWGNNGNNILTGGAGIDYLVGKGGNDTYVFNRGDGQDTIDNTDILTAIDTVRFGAGISDTDVLAFQYGNLMYFNIKGTADRITFSNYYGANTVNGYGVSDHKIDRVEFANGVVWDQAMIQSVVDRANFDHAPIVQTTLPALEASAGYNFSYTVPVDTIIDPDVWDSITYSVKMPDGSAVPAWLSFDAATRTFSGKPDVASIGSLEFVLWGTDNYGYSAGEYVTLNIVPNHAPVLVNPVADQSATDAMFSYVLPSTAFTDVESGGALSYSATLADGSVLPDWLSFDPATRLFSGWPISTGTISIRVTAMDDGNLSASDVFNIVVTAQNLSIEGTAGSDTLNGGLANDTLNGLAGDDVMIGNAGDDMINGGADIDSMRGGLGDDTYVVDNAADVITENFNEGVDSIQSSITLTLVANVENLTLTGSALINATGNALVNVLTGNAAANELDGGAGNDSLRGEAGNDTYLFGRGAGQDVVYDYDAAAGNLDRIQIAADLQPSDVVVSRDQLHLYLSINNPDGTTDKLTLENWFGGDAYKVEQVVFANGTIWDVQALNTMLNVSTEGADIFEGTSGNDVFNGLGGDDILRGYAGDDTLEGGTGNDYLYGGEGNDTYMFGRGYGQDIVYDYDTAAGNLDKIKMAADVLPGDVTVFKSGLNLYLRIGNPDGTTDTLTLANWFSDDAYKVEQVLFANGTVWDVPFLNTLANVATEGADILIGTSGNDIFNALGGDDRIYGYGGNDMLSGGDGADAIYGGDGNDTLAGGAGLFDFLYGGSGNDTYIYARGDWQDHIFEYDATPGNIDTVQINALSTDVTVVRDGNDLAININAFFSSDWLVMSNWFVNDAYKIEQVKFTDGVTWDAAKLAMLANAPTMANDLLYGTNENDVINGLDGDDVIYGLGGDDTLIGGGWGSDTLYGGDGNDRLTGGYSYNTLDGGNGNDILDGSAGVENIMKGGMGDDTYLVGDAGDMVTEYFNQGIDTVQSSFSINLSTFANVENLTLTGTTALNGTGNDMDNVLVGNSANNTLTGNAGNDTLDGGAGVDTMQGGVGDDTYMVDSSRDNVIENLNEGVDTVLSSISHSLADNVENLTLTGIAAINGTDNALNNLLTGNSAVNTLSGSSGNDILQGGAGNDVLKDSAGNNLLDGGAGGDTLTGAAGKELFIGGAGNDTITTGAGADIIAFNKGDGQDTVVASTGSDNTISLGGGINYVNLTMSKSVNNLILNTGNGEQIILQNWYKGTSNHSVKNLQVVLDSSTYNPVSSDTLLSQQVQTFDFAALANNFDQALAANPTLTSWSMTDALLTAHLAGSDTAALGGDLAYQYNLNSSLAGIGLASAQTVMNDANFGTAAQTLKPLAELQVGGVRLG
jgi:Ca2+-binding RTX toxin-like protein